MGNKTLENIITPVVESMGYEAVRISLNGQVRQTLQVMIDVNNGSREITVDDCAKVSRALSKVLDEKDPLPNQYTLEVSSPGIDRPLTKPQHFMRFKGYQAKLETTEIVDGRKRIKGQILDVDASNHVHILMDNKEYVVDFANIAKAKLVFDDALLNDASADLPDDTQF